MENPEQPELTNELDNFFNLSFDAIGRDHLKQIALWSKIASIAGLVSYAILLFLAIFGHTRLGSGNFWSLLLNVTVVGGGATVNYFLYRFATAVNRGIQNTDALYVNSGFNSLRMYFKTAGILAILVLCLFAIVIIGIVFSAMRGL